MKRLSEPAFYTLSDLAATWDVSVARIETYRDAGTVSGERLEVCACGPGAVDGVTPQEKRRFEGLPQFAERFPDGRFNPSDKASHQALIAALLLICYGKGSEIVSGHYELANQVEQDAALLGLAVDRSQETNAKIIREAQAILKQAGVTRGIKGDGFSEPSENQTLDRAA